ncbi:ferredoxin [Mycolicibacterium phlei]|uniref:Ferredoxin n=1 Tax=Mycolicibacterium phlei DSM 43239 = CCUG 21000 TaxID=1226750 RepID=A0A5N5VC91_MYCPH|nr:ferredoxin [Mycolicibacterium phlei]VEG11768.1 ferredoxin [Mycobacteroides chelonae]AMO63675.1 Ferredoxin-2 [Mycolicibacterium phlei]KAB7759495.1 ferredoxin [Mycolicibacterium phlei DSM 43239 = CCUG 21000]KXW60108.1 ferredoxin [Mycolicibacterium phlei DSM 43072]KXW68537.1 ferredoxin [Mycolicibacterium phlei DSM 43239 = CCUG 21000]
MRVSVDRDRCEGNAICVKYAPAVFELDDDDYSVVKLDPVPQAEWENGRKAVAECPRAALTLDE